MNSPPESQKKIQVTRMTRIVWADPIKDLLLELPEREREIIFEHMKYPRRFPHRHAVRTKAVSAAIGGFSRATGCVNYRATGGTVYIRGLWRSRIP
jgi:hypothetical protein